MSVSAIELRALVLIAQAELAGGPYCDFTAREPTRRLLALEGDERRSAVIEMAKAIGELAERIADLPAERIHQPDDRWWRVGEHRVWLCLLEALLGRDRVYDTGVWTEVFAGLARFDEFVGFDPDWIRTVVWRFTESRKDRPAVDGPLAEHLTRLAEALEATTGAEGAQLARKLREQCRSADVPPLVAGEAWADAAMTGLRGDSQANRGVWTGLLVHAGEVRGSSPSAGWFKSLAGLPRPEPQEFAARFSEWVKLLDAPNRADRRVNWRWRGHAQHALCDQNQEVLKGLCWIASGVPNADVARSLSRVVLSCYRKVPGIGPRAVKVGNAAVGALGRMPGREALGQLAMLSVKVKFGTAQKLIGKALGEVARREGLPVEEIAEIGVPAYGMGEVGRRVEELDGHRVELVVEDGTPQLRFFKPDGKPVKSVPARLKEAAGEELAELKGAVKDIAAMLPAQRERIDQLFLQRRVWEVGAWRERYLDHPLVGVIARRLVWRVGVGEGRPGTPACWLDEAGGLVRVDGTPLGEVGSGEGVALWHPLGEPIQTVLAWREFFERRRIRQPFKQAHREVYLLTDAERATRVYSNRYAAHVVRQHQFNALCAARGWKNKLRLMVDAEYEAPRRELGAYGLRAEFWVEGAGDEYGRDTNEAGVYNLLATDQVRFYRAGAATASAHAGGGGYSIGRAVPLAAGERAPEDDPNAPLALESVDPLVLSEIMRDVDLFVGVASVANNPNWQDGGPDNRYRDYWWSSGFGELSGTGASRRELLQRLVPRLAIADRVDFTDRFLRVRGNIRTYRIHLGSGNILMEPNDQYLCIVPSSRDEASGDVFLPFEGDRTLSIILSKAMLLAEDDKIKDPTITRQIRRDD